MENAEWRRRLALVGPCSVLLLPELASPTVSGIMAPVDFSEHSADSVQVAASIAKAAGLAECISNPHLLRPIFDSLRRTQEESRVR
jgi:hypothetical protein